MELVGGAHCLRAGGPPVTSVRVGDVRDLGISLSTGQ